MPEPDHRLLERAALALMGGQLVGIPTDTVYGLAAHPGREGSIEALLALKKRPPSVGLPVLVSGTEQADELAAGGLPEMAERVAKSFWPGAVTLVVRRRTGVEWALGGDATTIGMRCPAHSIALALCERVGPLATTSANLHGEAPIGTAEEIRTVFGDRVALVIDGGCLSGLASTVVDVTGEEVRCLREGAVLFSAILALFEEG